MLYLKSALCGIIFNVIIHVNSDLVEATISQPGNKYLQKNTFRRFRAYSLLGCVAECQMSSVCKSFTYNKKKDICRLNDINHGIEGTNISRNEFIHSDITIWSNLFGGPCSVKACSADSRCVVDRLHRVHCKPEFTGCGEPPDVAGAKKEYEGHYLYAEASYTCEDGYMLCHSNTTSVCQATGQWEGVSGLCGQYAWVNPKTDTYIDLPCGPTNKFTVAIRGTPTSNTRVYFNLMARSNLLLRINFMINHAGYNNVTLLTHLIDGSWGSYEIYDTMPLLVGEQFQMGVSLEHGVYTLKVGGDWVENYNQRNEEAVERLAFYADVTVSRVEFKL